MHTEGFETTIRVGFSNAGGAEPIEDLIAKGKTFYSIINYRHGLPKAGFVNYDHALNEARRMAMVHPGHDFHVVKNLSVSRCNSVTTTQLHPA